MKRYIITLILLITCTFTLTGCRNQTTDSGFKGNVEIAWDDVKDDFDQIDQDVENDTSKQDVKALTQTILDGYDKIKEGITQDNQEEAKKVYAAASRLEYIEKNTSVYQTLANHQNYYFTNDLAYELMCSIFNIKSNHFDETNSLASPQYKFTRDMLTTDLGKMYIKDDTTK